MSKVEYIRKDTNKKNRILLPSTKDSIKLNKNTLPLNIKRDIYRNNDSLIDEDEFENNIFNSKLITEEILKENNKTWSFREGSNREGSIRNGSIRDGSIRNGSIISSINKNRKGEIKGERKEERKGERKGERKSYEREFHDMENKMELVQRENIDLKEDINTLNKTNSELKKRIKEVSDDFEEYVNESKEKSDKYIEKTIKKRNEKYIEAEKLLKEKIKVNANTEKKLNEKILTLENKLKSDNTESNRLSVYVKDLETKISILNISIKQNSDLESQLRNERALCKNEIDRITRSLTFDLENLEKKKNKEINDNRIIYTNSLSNTTEQLSKLSLKLKTIQDENKIEILSLSQKHERTVNEKDKIIESIKSTFNTNIEKIHRDINSQIVIISNEYESKIKSLNLEHEKSIKEKEQDLVYMFQNLINKLETDKEKQLSQQEYILKEELRLKEESNINILRESSNLKSSNIELFNKIHLLTLENDNYKREIEKIVFANNEQVNKIKTDHSTLINEYESRIKYISNEYETQTRILNDSISKLNGKISLSSSESIFKDAKIKELNDIISEYKGKEKELNDCIKIISFNERELKSELKSMKESFLISESESKKIREINSLQEKSINEKIKILSIKDVEINNSFTENKNLNERLLKLQRELNNVIFSNNNLLAEKERLIETIKEQKEMNNMLISNNTELKTGISNSQELNRQLDIKNEKVKNYESIICSIESRNNELIKVNNTVSTRNIDLENQVKDMNSKLESSEKFISDLVSKTKEYDLINNKLVKDKISEDNNNNSLIKKLKENIEHLTKQNSELLKTASEKPILLKNCEIKDDSIKTLTMENTFIKDKIAKSDIIIKDLEFNLSNTRKDLNKINLTIEDYNKQVSSLHNDIERLNNIHDNTINEIKRNITREKEAIISEYNEKIIELNKKHKKDIRDYAMKEISRQNEIDKLTDSLNKFSTSEKTLNETKNEYTAIIDKLERSNKELNIKLSSQKNDIISNISSLSEEKNRLDEIIKDNISKYKSIENEYNKNINTIRVLEKSNSELSSKLEKANMELLNKSRDNLKLNEITIEKEKLYNESTIQQKRLRNKITLLTKEKQGLTEDISSLESKISELKNKNTEHIKEMKIKDEILNKIENSIKSINSSSITELDLLNLRKEKDDLTITMKKLVIENKYKTELYDKVYNNFIELNKKYDEISGNYTISVTDKQNLEIKIKCLNNDNIHLLSKVNDLTRLNENLNTQKMISTNIYENNIKDVQKDTNDRIIESNKSLEYRYKVQIHKLSDIIKTRTNELKFADDKYAKLMSEKFTEYTFRIQSLGDEIIKKDNEIKELLVKHEKDIKDTVINTESMFRTKMKLDPPTNYLRILKAKDHRIYVLQATLKSFRKDFQKKLVLLRNEISRLNTELKEQSNI